MIGDIRPGPGWRLREDGRCQNPTDLDTFRRTNAEYVGKKIGARRSGEFDDQLLQELVAEKRLGRVLGPTRAPAWVQDVPTHHFIASFVDLARRMAAETPDLVVFGHDLLNAYRQWPVRVPAQCGTFLGTRHGVTFWYHLAMNFGATASVWNFNRGADALQQLLRGLLLTTGHYVDDFNGLDDAILGESAMLSFQDLFAALGFLTKNLSPGAAAKLAGRVSFLTQAAFGSVAKAATKAIFARAADTAAWSADSLSTGLAAALRSLNRIIPAIKPRFIPFDAKDIEVAVLYADAFFSAGEVRHKAGHVPDGVSATQRQKAANGWGYVLRIGDQAAPQLQSDSGKEDKVLEEAAAAASGASSCASPSMAAPAATTSEASECVVRSCRRRPHRHSPFASQHGLCAEHWAEILKERDVLQREFNGGTLLDRFFSPHYWVPPPPILLKEKHHSRPFFAGLVCFLDDDRPKNRLFASYFLVLSVYALEQKSTAAQIPTRLASWKEEFPVVGPLFAVLALADCVTLGDLPEELQARWRRVEDSWQKSLCNSISPGADVGQNDINAEHAEDVLAIVAFWKHEGNECLKKMDLDGATGCYSEGTKLIKELPPAFVADDMVSKAMELEADLLNNFAHALLKMDRPQEAFSLATEALEIFEELGSGVAAKRVKALYRCGTACRVQGDCGKARDYFTGALRLDPANDEVHNAMRLLGPPVGKACCAITGRREETLEWLNELVAQLWPNINNAVQKIVHEQVTPQLQASLPSFLKGTHFKTFTLGTITPKFGPIELVSRKHGLKLNLHLDYESNVDIEVSAVIASIGIKSIRLRGELVLRLEPLIHETPVVGGITVFFNDPPELGLDFTGIANLADVPGIAGIIRHQINAAISNAMVLPNVIAVPIATPAQGVDMADLVKPLPLAVLRVTAVRAKDITAKDWHLLGKASSDTYVSGAGRRVSLASDSWNSSVQKRTCNPVWGEGDFHDFMVFDHDQRLCIEVYDSDYLTNSDFIGKPKWPIKASEAVRNSGVPLPLVDPKSPDEKCCGTLEMKFEWLQLSAWDASTADTGLGAKAKGTLVKLGVNRMTFPPSFGKAASETFSPVTRRRLDSEERTSKVHRIKEPSPDVVSVAGALARVARQCKAQGLKMEAIQEITGLSKEEVNAALADSDKKEGTAAAVRPEICMDVVFYFSVYEDAKKLDFTVTALDEKMKPYATFTSSVGDAAAAIDAKPTVRTLKLNEGEGSVQADLEVFGRRWTEDLSNPVNLELLSAGAGCVPDVLQQQGEQGVCPSPSVEISSCAWAGLSVLRPGFVSEEWAHVLAWDLFVGRWIYLDGQRRGIFTSHSVLFCNLIGPPGLLMHAITCFVGLPKEEGLEDPNSRAVKKLAASAVPDDSPKERSPGGSSSSKDWCKDATSDVQKPNRHTDFVRIVPPARPAPRASGFRCGEALPKGPDVLVLPTLKHRLDLRPVLEAIDRWGRSPNGDKKDAVAMRSVVFSTASLPTIRLFDACWQTTLHEFEQKGKLASKAWNVTAGRPS
eukprot:s539_g26.t2